MIKGNRGMVDYAGNAGLHTRTGWSWGDGSNGGVIIRRDRGVRMITIPLIVDGTSNVILASEKRLDIGGVLWRSQCDDNEGVTSGWDWDIVRWGNDPPLPDRNAGNDVCERRFGSSHPSGIQAVLCDASVQFISWKIEQDHVSTFVPTRRRRTREVRAISRAFLAKIATLLFVKSFRRGFSLVQFQSVDPAQLTSRGA